MQVSGRAGARALRYGLTLVACVWALCTTSAHAQQAPTGNEATQEPPDESLLGELLITGDAQVRQTPIAVLPSLSPDLEDVIIRTVVRRDLELTGMFRVIPDEKAPDGLYGFDDPVDVRAWTRIGAEVIVKVAARKLPGGQVKLFGLCYFPSYGTNPVYEKTLVVDPSQVRITAHRITDGLLGAITGRPGGFASHLTYAARLGKNHAIYTLDADGHDLRAQTNAADTSIAPFWGPEGGLFYSRSRRYSPFHLIQHQGEKRVSLPFKESVYSADFSPDFQRLAVAVARPGGSAIYVGNADGSDMQKVSRTEVATHPVFSPSGKLAWVGGGSGPGGRRIYVDGKPVSPPGFAAYAPVFCDTEDGVFLVYAVSVGAGQDLLRSDERGGQMARLTQGQGSNSYPACSPDGRMLAFFSTRKNEPGLHILSLKSGKSLRISERRGESLRWAALPPPPSP